jgi:hypothetical protein
MMRILALAILTIATIWTATPIMAQTYDPKYPVIGRGHFHGTVSDLSFEIEVNRQACFLGAQVIGSSGKRPGAISRRCVPNSDHGASNNGYANVGRDDSL